MNRGGLIRGAIFSLIAMVGATTMVIAQPVEEEIPVASPVLFTADFTLPGYGGSPSGGITLNGVSQTLSGPNYPTTITTPWRCASLRPWKTYVLSISMSSGVSQANVTLLPPNGYTLFIDGQERRTFSLTAAGYKEIEIRPKTLFAPGQIGDATALQFPVYCWGVSLGTLINGQSAGHLFFLEDNLSDTFYSPDSLFYTKDSSEVEVIKSGQTLRQLKAWQGLADIVVTGTYSYEIRFYRPEDVGTRTGTDPYAVSGTPIMKFAIERAVSGSNSGIKITKTIGALTEVTTVDAISGGWRLTGNGGDRLEEKTSVVSGGITYQQDIVKNAAGTVAAKTWRQYQAFAWGNRVVQRIDDPSGSSPVSCTTTYDDVISGGNIYNATSYGRIVSVVCSDGYFCRYDYHTSADRYGQLWREFMPDGDTPTSLSGISPFPLNCRQIVHDWAADWTGRRVLWSYTNDSHPNRYEAATIDTTGVANSQPLNDNVNVYATGSTPPTSHLTYFRRQLYDTVYVNLLYSSVEVDGRMTSYVYHHGDWNASTHTFTVNEPSGKAWRETSFAGWASAPSGYTSTVVNSLDSVNLAGLYLVANKSIKSVTYRDTKANIVRTERYVFTGGTSYELVDWTDFTYNDASRLVSTTKSNGEVTENEWTDGRKTATIDSGGIRTEYTFDDLGRVVTSTKKGIAAAGGFAAQPDVVTTFIYDAAGHVLSQTTSASSLTLVTSSQYDLAGRLTQQTEPGGTSGMVTQYAYANGGSQETITYADGTTKIIDYYRDRRVKSVTGTAVVAEYHTSSADNTDIVRLGSSTNTNYSSTLKDCYGHLLTQKPNPYWTKSFTYNTKMQLDWSQETSVGYASYPRIFTIYNSLGEAFRRGGDTSNDWALSPAGDEMIGETSDDLVKEGSDWWAVHAEKIYSTPGSNTLITTGTTKRRLSGFASGIVSEERAIDVFGNVTTKQVEVDRSAKKMINRTIAPDSSTSEEATSINGLAVQKRTRQNQTFVTNYDALGRAVESVDPRTGSATVAYESGSSRVASRTDAAGKTTSFTYDAVGRVLTETNPLGKVTRREYTARGEVRHVWGDTTYPVEYVYDSSGRKSEMHTYRGGSGWTGTTWPTTTGTADVTVWEYDSITGFLSKKTFPDGNYVQYTTAPDGTVRTFTTARGRTIDYQYFYNSLTGAREVTNRTWQGETWWDDDAQNYVTDSFSDSRTYNRIGKIESENSSGACVTYAYNLNGTLELQSESFSGLPGTRMLTRKYETSGVVGRNQGFKLGTSGSPAADEEMTYGYDTYGRLGTVTAAFAGGAGRTTTYGYTTDSNLLASISTPTSGTDVFAMSRLYEPHRDLMTTTSAAINTTTVKAAYTYAYDDLGRRTSVIETGELFNGYAASSPGLVEKYTYNDRSELATANTFVGNTVSTTTALPGRDYGYSYDPIGNRTQTTTNSQTANYSANSNNQYSSRGVPGYYDVAGAADPAATVFVNTLSTQRSQEYFYRAAPFTNTSVPVYGNVAIDVILGGTTTTTTGKAFVAKTPENFSYDADGNLLSDGRLNYTWDAFNRLLTIETNSAAHTAGAPIYLIQFTYDAQDRRVEKKVYLNSSLQSDTRFVYDGWNVIAELNSSGTTTRRHAWGLDFSGTLQGAGGVGGLLMENDSAVTYLAAHDARGNVTALINAADNSIAAAYEYSPFGEIVRQSGTYAASNPWRFSTKYYDQETGLIDFGHRFYSPSQGRFLGRDPSEEKGGLNLYGFCLNNAINLWDVLGMDPVDPTSITGLAQRLQGYIDNLDPNDLRGGFLKTQETILNGIAKTSGDWNAQDQAWIKGVVGDFMNPLFNALDGKFDDNNKQWQSTLDKVASLTQQNAGLAAAAKSAFDPDAAMAANNQMLINDLTAGAMMANTHIREDLRQAMINNGVGTDANYATVGKIVNDATKDTYGDVLTALSHFGGTFIHRVDPAKIRDDIRNALKKDGVPTYTHPLVSRRPSQPIQSGFVITFGITPNGDDYNDDFAAENEIDALNVMVAIKSRNHL